MEELREMTSASSSRPIAPLGGVVQSQKGPIIAVMHQYALLNKGHSIHSPCQFESYNVTVDDKSVRAGGTQRIQTPAGYTIPLTIKDGLARLAIRPYTDQEWDSLPHVFLTDEANWDPSVLDHQYNSVEEWLDPTYTVDTDPAANQFDDVSKYWRRVVIQKSKNTYNQLYNMDCDPAVTTSDATEQHTPPIVALKDITNKEPNYEDLRPQFGWLSMDTIKRTYLDDQNGNRLWQNAVALELKQINEYGVFTDVRQTAGLL
jgi:hypothetical protein